MKLSKTIATKDEVEDDGTMGKTINVLLKLFIELGS